MTIPLLSNETFLLIPHRLICPSPLLCFGCQSLISSVVRYQLTGARCFCLTLQFLPLFSHLRWMKGAAVHSSTWRVEQRSAGDISAIYKPPLPFACHWEMIGKTSGLLLLSHSHWPSVGWRFKASLSLLRVAGKSVLCFFWQGPMLEGLSNRTSMSKEKYTEGLYNIILFRLECGGPEEGLCKQSASGMWEDSMTHYILAAAQSCYFKKRTRKVHVKGTFTCICCTLVIVLELCWIVYAFVFL